MIRYIIIARASDGLILCESIKFYNNKQRCLGLLKAKTELKIKLKENLLQKSPKEVETTTLKSQYNL